MSLKRKRDWSKPLTKTEIRNGLGDWKMVPAKILLEVIEVEHLHKSPCSLSFYNKKKDWNYTEPETIRWSNHWNFLTKRTGEKIHSITNISVPDNTWARGKYLEGIFIIEEIYENIFFTNAEHRDLTFKLSETVSVKPSEEVINKRRALKKAIENGEVKLNYSNGKIGVIKKFSSQKIVLEDETCFDRKVDGKTCYSNFRTLIPNFALILDGKEYSEEMLFAENLL